MQPPCLLTKKKVTNIIGEFTRKFSFKQNRYSALCLTFTTYIAKSCILLLSLKISSCQKISV